MRIENPDLLGLMMNESELTNSPHISKKGISKEEISGQGIIFFIAGFDTTHATFNHIFYHLAREPQWQERLYTELQPIRHELNYDRVRSLPVLNAIINECLRLHPPLIIISREAPEECELLNTGIRIPKNCVLQIQPEVIHRDEEYFPDGNSFKPERFLQDPTLESHFAFMPFGAGPRLCVGKRFAQNELRIGVAHFVLNYRIGIDPNFEVK